MPTLNIKSEGIYTSAKEWIKQAPESGDSTTPLIIRKSEQNGYDIIISGNIIHVDSNKSKENNKEIEEVVIKHLN
jgi:hypothetical protein